MRWSPRPRRTSSQPGLVDAEFGEQVGEIMQVPTAVSAIKVDGQRAYARVRAGEQVELKARPVTIHSLAVLDQRVVGDHLDVDISVRCSSGTYIRAIARDVGAALGVGGHLTALRRTAVGPFDLSLAHTLDELADDFTLLPIAQAARASFASVDLDEEQAAHVRFGRSLDLALEGPGPHALFAPDGEFLALYEPAAERGSAGGGLRRVVRLPVRVVRGLDRSGIRWHVGLGGGMCRHDVSPDRGRRPTGELMTVKTIGAALVSAALVASLAGTAVTAEAAPTTSKAAASVAVTIDAKRMITMPATVQPGVNEFARHRAPSRRASSSLSLAAGYTIEEADADIKKGLEGGKMSRRCKRFEANVTLIGGVASLAGKASHVLGRPASRAPTIALDIFGKANASKWRHRSRSPASTPGPIMPSGATVKAVRDAKWANKPEVDPAQGHADLQEPLAPRTTSWSWRR